MRSRVRRIAVTIAVLPLLVLVGLRSTWAAYACRIDREVRSACCCPKSTQASRSADRHRGDDQPRVQASGCCEVTMGESAAPPDARAAHPRTDTDDAPALVVAAAGAPAVPPQPLAVPGAAGFARPPPARSNPIYLVHRTILR